MPGQKIGRFLSVLCCCAILFLIASCAAGGGGPEYIRAPAPSLQESLLGEEPRREFAVLLPPGYSPQARPYPVLYFLPGFSADLRQTARALMRAMRAQPASGREMILVVVDGTSRLGGGFYTNSPVTGNWEDYVTQDIAGYIDSHYNTRRTAQGRGIAGHSMGGFGALWLAMRHPGQFGYVYSMSPGLFDENGLARSGIDFARLQASVETYAALPEADALAAYLRDVKSMNWPDNFAHAYAAAFAYDTTVDFPYIQVPGSDEIRARYERGFGGWAAKLDAYRENLLSLGGIAVDYGRQDALTWIPEGAAHFCALLEERQIPHTETPYPGGHVDCLDERFAAHMLPFFAQAFAS